MYLRRLSNLMYSNLIVERLVDGFWTDFEKIQRMILTLHVSDTMTTLLRHENLKGLKELFYVGREMPIDISNRRLEEVRGILHGRRYILLALFRSIIEEIQDRKPGIMLPKLKAGKLSWIPGAGSSVGASTLSA